MTDNGNGKSLTWKRAAWVKKLLGRALSLTNDGEEAWNCVEMALERQPFPPETEIDPPDDQDADWREEGEEIGTGDGKPVDAEFSFDIFNPKAQGILNKALVAAKGLSARARKELNNIFKARTVQIMARDLESWAARWRSKLAELLSQTQLASLLAGMRQVAAAVPLSPPLGVKDAVLPASLPPEDAQRLLAELRDLPADKRERRIYDLPPDQQGFVRTVLAAESAGKPPVPPIVPPKPPAGAPEGLHFPVIDEAAKLLSEKNLVTRPEFDRLDAAARAKAFTVAGVSSEETLGKIRDVMSEQITKGVDIKEFRERILSEVEPGTFISDAHLENVFRTNVQGAFTDGQNKILDHPFVRSGFPYAAYEPIHDDRVRPEHKEMEHVGIDGTNIFRIDDPVFRTFQPPWDFSCRCSWYPMSIRMAAEKGINEAKTWLNTGTEPTPPAYVPFPAFQPPPGFQRSLAAAPLSIRLSLASLSIFEDDEEEEDKPDGSLEPGVSRVGANSSSTGDWADKKDKDKVKANKVKRLRKYFKKHGKKRKLSRGFRQPKAWAELAIDAPLDGDKYHFSFPGPSVPFQWPDVNLAATWTEYGQSRGGQKRWKNANTGEIRYQETMPSDGGGQARDSTANKGASGVKDETELTAKADALAADTAKKTQGALAKLGNAGKWLKDRTMQVYQGLEQRYGRKTAIAIFAAGHVVGLGTPLVVVPGSTLIGMAPFAAMAEVYLQVRKMVKA